MERGARQTLRRERQTTFIPFGEACVRELAPGSDNESGTKASKINDEARREIEHRVHAIEPRLRSRPFLPVSRREGAFSHGCELLLARMFYASSELRARTRFDSRETGLLSALD